MPQLDALRALAALVVTYIHTGPPEAQLNLPLALWSVQLFFVLSGFIITGILLDCRELPHSRLYELRQFYIRRALRIFPLYYAVILGMFVLGQPLIRQSLHWHLTYTSNVYTALQNDWGGSISHLWSLSVEQHFYLIWPWLIFFVPSRALVPTIVATIVMAPIYRIVGLHFGLHSIALEVITPSSFDALGLGALLGVWRHRKPKSFASTTKHRVYQWLGLPLLLLAVATRLIPLGSSSVVLSPLCSAVMLAWLIHRCAVGVKGPTRLVLEAKPLLYLGRISYGIYLWHNFAPRIAYEVLGFLHLNAPSLHITNYLLFLATTIIISSCSWFWFERPVNNLKSRFSYI